MKGAAADKLSSLSIPCELGVFAAGDPRILALYLFGSRGRHEETKESDVDVGVLFRQPQSLREVLILEDELERRLGLPVDVVDAGRASAFLALDVIRGERVSCADADRCDDFELYVMRRAGDLAPVERERRRLLLQPLSPAKIQLKIVAAKTELIRTMLAAIATLPLASEAEFSADIRMMAAGESFLRRSLEALLDLGRHVLAKGFGKVVPDYAAVADELGAQEILPPESVAKLRLMARYRNRMVHFYDEIMAPELYGILTRECGDVEEILAAIQSWLGAHPELCDEEL